MNVEQHSGLPVGLRERRRRETLSEITEAALDLFESRGVAATTVDDIAQAVGISARTFFRYFPTKEHAVFHEDEAIDRMLEVISAHTSDVPVAQTLEVAWLELVDLVDSRPEEFNTTRRVRHLISCEPALLAVALARDAERIEQITAAAVEVCTDDPLAVRALVTVMDAMIRVVFDEWARRVENGERVHVRDVYISVRRGLEPHYATLAQADF